MIIYENAFSGAIPFSCLLMLIIGFVVMLLFIAIQVFLDRKSISVYQPKPIEVAVLACLGCIFFGIVGIYRPKGLILLGLCVSILAFSSYHLLKGGLVCLKMITRRTIFVWTIVACGLAILSIRGFKTDPMYDANLYYGQIVQSYNSFVLEGGNFWEDFTIWGKQFHSLAPFLIVGEFICRGTCRGLYFIDLLLLFVAMICVYKMLSEDFKGITKIQATLLAFLFAVFPFVFVGVFYICPTFYSLIFFVFAVFCYRKELYWLFAYSVLCFIGSSSNMAISYVVFLGITELFLFLKTKKLGKYLIERPLALYICPLETWMFLYIIRVVSTPVLLLGENTALQKIINRIYQCFSLGLRWLILLMAVICLVYYLFMSKKKNGRELINKYYLEIAVVVSTFAQLIILIIFNFRLPLSPRYMTIQAIAMIFIMAFVLQYLKRKIVQNIVMLTICALFTVQLFITIDPVLIAVGDKVKFKNGNVYLGITKNINEPIGIGDNVAYNYEYTMWDGIFNEMLSDITWTDDIVFLSEWNSENRKGTEDFRFGISYAEIYKIYWDSINNRITYYPKNDKTYGISIRSIIERRHAPIMNKYLREPVVYFLIPDALEGRQLEEFIDKGFKIKEERLYKNQKTELKLLILENENI